MQQIINRVEKAIAELQSGKMIILTDHPERENEGDLIIAAEKITPASMNFMIQHGCGIVCLTMTPDHLKKLNIPLMVPTDKNTSSSTTPFTISIDAKNGITTGVSAADRSATILATIADDATENDLVMPGHIFPLEAKVNGVLERQGHTEGSIDIVKLAGFKPTAVICELMNPDGTMTRGAELTNFANKHDLTVLAIDDLLAYRIYHEDLIAEETSSEFHLQPYGKCKITAIREKITAKEHIIIQKESKDPENVLVRVHSSCLTGDLFGSARCDCHQQLHYSLAKINEEGGILIYLNQEGRGIGLFNKIKAYSLQEQGFDTVEANQELGLPIDSREYYIAANILRRKGIHKIRLLTNNPNKIAGLKKFGIESITKEPMPSFQHEHNQFYLRTKNTKLNHSINFNLNIEEIYKVI